MTIYQIYDFGQVPYIVFSAWLVLWIKKMVDFSLNLFQKYNLYKNLLSGSA